MKKVIAGFLFAICATPAFAEEPDCTVPPLNFNSYNVELESSLRVRAGKGCGFGLSGIEGAIAEARIVTKPKFGIAGVQGLKPYYIAKRGYHGPDEFSYVFGGTDAYGGPMRVTIKRKVEVIP